MLINLPREKLSIVVFFLLILIAFRIVFGLWQRDFSELNELGRLAPLLRVLRPLTDEVAVALRQGERDHHILFRDLASDIRTQPLDRPIVTP